MVDNQIREVVSKSMDSLPQFLPLVEYPTLRMVLGLPKAHFMEIDIAIANLSGARESISILCGVLDGFKFYLYSPDGQFKELGSHDGFSARARPLVLTSLEPLKIPRLFQANLAAISHKHMHVDFKVCPPSRIDMLASSYILVRNGKAVWLGHASAANNLGIDVAELPSWVG